MSLRLNVSKIATIFCGLRSDYVSLFRIRQTMRCRPSVRCTSLKNSFLKDPSGCNSTIDLQSQHQSPFLKKIPKPAKERQVTMSFRELLFGFTPRTISRHPECFVEGNTDRHLCSRTVPMEVLSLGFSRTGTASMQAALTILGWDTYHGFSLFGNVLDCDMWDEAYAAKFFSRSSEPYARKGKGVVLDGTFFDKLLGHVGAVTDMPAISFATELIAAYPDAKVVLVEREGESWYASFEKAAVVPYENSVFPWTAWLDPGYTGRLWRMMTVGFAKGQFGARNGEEFRANARPTYRRHYEEVREALREQPERLLEYVCDAQSVD